MPVPQSGDPDRPLPAKRVHWHAHLAIGLLELQPQLHAEVDVRNCWQQVGRCVDVAVHNIDPSPYLGSRVRVKFWSN